MTNWLTIIEKLKNGSEVTVDPSRWNLNNPEYNKIYDIWKTANFNLQAIKWTNYYPGVHFSENVVKETAEELKIQHIHRSWISKIDSGFMAPWHWDVDDHEEEYLKYGPIKRYTVIIEQMAHGQILIIGNDYYFNKPAGTIIKWENYREWHSGINAGMSPSYMLHILGS